MTAEVNGIDVSEFQGVIDWPTVASQTTLPLTVAVARATYGATYIDHQWATNWPALAKTGLVRGVYHFAVPGTSPTVAQNAQAQAAFFLAVLDKAGGWRALQDLSPVLDLEVANGLTPAQLQEWAGAWIDALKTALGGRYTPIVYSNVNFWQAYLAPLASVARFWGADYSASVPEAHIAHQYTDALTLPGITGHVDGDHWDTAALPTVTSPAAPGVVWTARPGGVAWSFTPPDASTGYTGWAQTANNVAAPTAPSFTSDGGYWQWRWAPPGATALVLTFFWGRQTATASYPIPLASNAVIAATAAVSADVATLQTHVAALSSAAAKLNN